MANLSALGSNPVSTTGNVTAGYVIGNGSTLTNLTGGNVTGTVANATYATSAGSATTAGTVTTAAQPNITSVGTLSSLTVTGNISTTANIAGGFFIGNGSQLTGLPAGYSNADVATYLASGTNTSNIVTTGNISGGNIAATSASISGIQTTNLDVVNISARDASGVNIGAGGFNNLVVLETGVLVQNVPLTVSGNVSGGNISTAGAVSATGNLTANNVSTGNVTATRLQNDGNLEIRSNVAGTARTWTLDVLGDFNLPVGGNISGSGYVTAIRMITDPRPLANLTAVAGGRAFVSDGNLVATGNFGEQIGGGGANTVPVWSDGVNWYVG